MKIIIIEFTKYIISVVALFLNYQFGAIKGINYGGNKTLNQSSKNCLSSVWKMDSNNKKMTKYKYK